MIIHAPLTAEQVESLDGWQNCDRFHPFTCCDHVVMVARTDGMYCEACGRVQTWVHGFMADGRLLALHGKRTTMKEKQVLFSSDEAATYRTGLSGWVDRHGSYWGEDERTARYAGSTHKECDRCEKLVTKGYCLCNGCRDLATAKRHALRERKRWDGESPLYSEWADLWIYDEDQLQEILLEREMDDADDLLLVIGEPNNLREVDSEYWGDDLEEDGELPPEIESAIDALNVVIRDNPHVTWNAGKFAADLTTGEPR